MGNCGQSNEYSYSMRFRQYQILQVRSDAPSSSSGKKDEGQIHSISEKSNRAGRKDLCFVSGRATGTTKNLLKICYSWSTFLIDHCASIATGWPSVLDSNRITTPLPRLWTEYENVRMRLKADRQRQKDPMADFHAHRRRIARFLANP